MRRVSVVFVACLVALVCVTGSTRADLVVPASYEFTEGSSGNAMPFHVGILAAHSSARYQQVFDSSEFGSDSIFFGGIYFRPDATSGASFGPTVLNNVVVQLSTSLNAVDSLSVVYANNIGADVLTVFSGNLTLSSADTGPGAGPKDFDIYIPFTSAFHYDPTLGDLLLDITNPNNSVTTWIDTASANGDAVSRAFGSSGAASGATDSNGLIVKFEVVPEPATWLLLGLGLAGLGYARRRRRVKA